MLGVRTIVYHANFIASIHNDGYRADWTRRQVDFWGPLAERGKTLGLVLALENMWEFDPTIIQEVLRQVNHPALRACLDVGHAHLFSAVDFETWLKVMEPYLVHTHLNNNLGEVDEHLGFDAGVLNYNHVLQTLRALPHPPAFSLEIEEVADIRRSLPYLDLPGARKG